MDYAFKSDFFSFRVEIFYINWFKFFLWFVPVVLVNMNDPTLR